MHAEQNDRKLGHLFPQLLGQGQAIHVRHDDIGQNQADLSLATLHLGQGGHARFSFVSRVAVLAQDADDHTPNCWRVIDDKDGSGGVQ
jgi:hypothetical protein